MNCRSEIDLTSQATKKVAAEILRYCGAHPNARDSLEGITWWVAHQCFDDAKTFVPRAVELLMERGDLERIQLGDGSHVYGCLSKEKKEIG